MPQIKIYTPRGAAGEYAELACNLSTGCPNGCIYCYAPHQLHRAREVFHDPACAAPRKGILGSIRQEAHRHRGRNVFLCFTTDPCLPSLIHTTKTAVSILNAEKVGVTILTKCDGSSLLPTLAAYPGNRYGATLTLMDETRRKLWEPKAPPFAVRVAALKKAHALGLRTWVSLEPVIDPEQTLLIIEETHAFVDEFAVGKMNHEHTLPAHLQPAIKAIDWRRFHDNAVQCLQSLGCQYSIKRDLLDAAGL